MSIFISAPPDTTSISVGIWSSSNTLIISWADESIPIVVSVPLAQERKTPTPVQGEEVVIEELPSCI